MTTPTFFNNTLHDPIHQPTKVYYVLQRKFDTINGRIFSDDIRTTDKKIAQKEFKDYKKLGMIGYGIRILKISSEVIQN